MIFRSLISLTHISLILIFGAGVAEAATFLNPKSCFNPKSECVEPGGTKHFEGVAVTLDCWRYKITYECKEDSDNNCQELRNQGCSPAGARCKSMWGKVCGVQEVIYDCPINKCYNEELPYNNPNTFCVTGDCVPQERSKDQDMHKSLAALSAAAEVAKHLDTVDPNNPKIFKGKSRECSKNILSGITKDCCGISPSGFLEGKILKCDQEEMELAQAKETGRSIYLGEYCHNEVLGVCTSYHQTYCIYQSKLARIIQVAARSQFGVDLGGPKSAICRELTMDEFKKLDFSKVDFSEFYRDIENKMKSSKANQSPELTNQLKQNTEELKQQAASHKENVEKMREKMQAKMRSVPEKTEPLTEEAIKQREKEKKEGWK